jgi:threonine/homoserine/homoserine lactone efflux protein
VALHVWLTFVAASAVMGLAPRPGEVRTRAPTTPRTAFASNVALGTFHPKTIVFFVAFVPQFIDSHANYAPQALILIATFAIVVGLTDTAYALATSSASRLLRRSSAAVWMQRAGAGVLIAVGTATAVSRT